MGVQQLDGYSHQEYFELEGKGEIKHEYCNGEIFAMTGASLDHNRIARNITSFLTAKLDGGKYEPFMGDVRLFIEAYNLFTYPDILVICDKIQTYEQRRDTVTNPALIFEVLSKSTMNYDRGQKFEFYRSIPSLTEYILVDQHRVMIECFSRKPKGSWELMETRDISADLTLPGLGLELPLEKIYRSVVFSS